MTGVKKTASKSAPSRLKQAKHPKQRKLKRRYGLSKFTVASALALLLFAAVSAIVLLLSSQAQTPSRGECRAGYYPVLTSIVRNSNFEIAPTTIFPNGHPGNNFSSIGYYYADASFYSQTANTGVDVYPTQENNLRNSFSVQDGSFVGSANGGPPEINQLPFPGDPTFGVPGTNTWFYSNGNIHNGAEYLIWEQDVSGLTVGKEYVFATYISNAIEPPFDSFSDPVIRLRIGGATGLPNGQTIIGPINDLSELSTSNSQPLNGWRRIGFAFTATATTEKLKITSAATSIFGDDFGMTAVILQECVPIASPTPTPRITPTPTTTPRPSPTPTVSPSPTPSPTPPPLTRTFECNVSSANPQMPVAVNQPVVFTAAFVQSGSATAPSPGDYRVRTTIVTETSGAIQVLPDMIPTLRQSGAQYYLDYSHTMVSPDPNSAGKVTASFQLLPQVPDVVVRPGQCPVSYLLYNRPYFEVRQNDVWTGATFAESSVTGCSIANQDAQIRTFARKGTDGRWQGASVDFAATATGAIDGTSAQSASNNYGNAQAFISAARLSTGIAPSAPNFASYSNTRAGDSTYLGGNFDDGVGGGITHCIPDYFNTTRVEASQIINLASNTIGPSDLQNGRQHTAAGIVTLQGGTYPLRATLYIDGDLYIENDITYGSYAINPANPLSIPYLSIIVRGNIYIGSNVRNIDAFLVAQPTSISPTTTGKLVTCAQKGAAATPVALVQVRTACQQPLTIRGAVVARSIMFLRSGGNAGYSGASERILSSGALYAGKPVFRPKSGSSLIDRYYMSLTGLPPIY